ncbi:DUF2780 domain-containing protein [Solimonas soli]|uniref:DUF2780 domain-containing protein n=1 Tax=Solimonas soli TaxID=413479 RepID=UPI0004B4C557|nr:DUF2780 domain-containing protein [Solimonas soli]
MNEIIDKLASQFGIAPAQAESAAGAVLKFVQHKVSNGDFQKLLAAAPQLQAWIAKAGQAPAAGSGGGGLLGELVGGIASGLGGEGGIAGVLAALQNAGLDGEGAAQFVPALIQKLSANLDPALVAKVLEQVPAVQSLGGAGGLEKLGSLLGGLGKI